MTQLKLDVVLLCRFPLIEWFPAIWGSVNRYFGPNTVLDWAAKQGYSSL